MYYRAISISHNIIGRNTCYVKICNDKFLKVDNGDESFKSSASDFHSLMGDGIQYFSEILVRLY